MMHALIRNASIVLTGPLPYPTWPDSETGRWWDMRDPAQVAEAGWVEVTVQPRPADTATTIWERGEPRLVAGVPTVQWVERDKTAEEIAAEADAAAARERYETHEGILDATAALMDNAHVDGAPWVAPEGAHNAYPLGRTVTHNGKTWRSKHYANVWEPSASSPWWEEVIDGDPGPQPWALDVYYTPPTKVAFEGSTYECTFEHLSQVGWEPSNPSMHSVWKLTTP